jgi:hypothetical protein
VDWNDVMEVPFSQVDGLLEYILKAADKAAFDAGIGGSYSDGGASNMREQVAMFNHGRSSTIPKKWDKHYKEYIREVDPDYATYLQLQKKFG